MSLTDTKLRALRPRQTPYQMADGGGLFIEVTPSGKRVWRLRYRLDGRQEKVTLGEYPAYPLAAARKWREECREMIGRQESPMRAKREAKEQAKGLDTVEVFSKRWLTEVVETGPLARLADEGRLAVIQCQTLARSGRKGAPNWPAASDRCQ